MQRANEVPASCQCLVPDFVVAPVLDAAPDGNSGAAVTVDGVTCLPEMLNGESVESNIT